ncbi:hypothetical protein NQ318_002546 [Aromia moschata]|uniref:J domain-containing protein n=1 Tax=Aromia moschata TaxID=1265417 RepID=A0AAV8XTF2_9CUCU|nr:hypothetical protein NQ318_002546 [Aromia moschata]
MKCRYEVLDVPRDANEAEIKAAYEKLVLKWHPDNNLDNPEYAREQLQIIQQAYETLSDPEERAWYNRYWEPVLRRYSANYQDNSLDVNPYLTPACFQGHNDDDKGFYSVYRDVFEKIVKEELNFMDKIEFSKIPSFGNSITNYEEVAEFYGHWSNYSTKKSYIWLNNENKNDRQQAKKKRNEEIRNLVTFVMELDARLQDQKNNQEEIFLAYKQNSEQLRTPKKVRKTAAIIKTSYFPLYCM